MPNTIVFPYTSETCWGHRRYCVLVDGQYVTKCSLCNAALDSVIEAKDSSLITIIPS